MAAELPRIRSRDAEVVNFASSMVPRYLRRSESISAWAAFAYLKGISERDFTAVLEVTYLFADGVYQEIRDNPKI